MFVCSCLIGYSQAKKKSILFLAGKDSHGLGAHEFIAGCKLLANCINKSGLNATAKVVEIEKWGKDNSIFEGVDCIVIYCDGFKGHPLYKHDRFKFIDGLMKKGVSIGFMHYACSVPKEKGDFFKSWIGGHYLRYYSYNPHWTCKAILKKGHPCCSGVKPFELLDEWYFNMAFATNMKIDHVLKGIPCDKARQGKLKGGWPRGPFKHITDASGRQETLLWTVDRKDGGRGFGFTGGHFHHNWKNDDLRKLMLNTILWSAKVKIPKDGVASKTPTEEEMKANRKDSRRKKK